jgi:hypothetical protein
MNDNQHHNRPKLTLSTNDTQHNNIQYMLSVAYSYCYARCHYADSHYV